MWRLLDRRLTLGVSGSERPIWRSRFHRSTVITSKPIRAFGPSPKRNAPSSRRMVVHPAAIATKKASDLGSVEHARWPDLSGRNEETPLGEDVC